MRRSFVLLLASMIVAAGVSAACKQKQAAQDTADEGEDASAPSGDDDTNKGDDDDSASEPTKPAEPATGLPCDVQATVENRCAVCHGTVAPQGPPLLKYEDFAAKSSADPAKTRGQLAAEYMKAKTMPMAPGVATEAEIQIIEDWVTGGMKKSEEACILEPAGTTTATDAGDAATPTPGADAGLCTSGVRWTQGNTKSALMHPGGACIACHSTQQGGPALSFAGTVFPTLHEVDDCNGSKGPITVVVKDRRNKTVTMQTNEVGNFMAFTETVEDLDLRAPFRVEIRQPGKPTRKMNRTITGGDCNACHTVNGTVVSGAAPPGRIVEPGAPLQ